MGALIAFIITYISLGLLVIIIVQWAPKPNSNFSGPYTTLSQLGQSKVYQAWSA